MVVGPNRLAIPIPALLALVAATLFVSQSVIVGKSISANHPAVTNAFALATGAVTLLCLSMITGETWAIPRTSAVKWSLAYLVVLGSAGLFAVVMLVVRRWTASATSYMFVLFPLVTMVLGAGLLDERITAQGILGGTLVMLGAWFGALAPSPQRNVPNSAAETGRPALDAG
jgi:drug/metabolite transporter (DMT)-like permease